MKKLYWQSVEINDQKFFFTVTEAGLNFVSSPGRFLSEIFDFYPDNRYRYQFMYDEAITEPYLNEFTEYFAKKRKQFDLPLDFDGLGTQLQRQTWAAIMKVPYGQTITYKQLAENVGRPKAIRAVATAVAQNPLLIVVPCHRIIKSSGEIGEYRGGRAAKKSLLEFEKAPISKQPLIKKLPLPKISQLGKPDL
ncbi:methylated-DNA--[protein]-cysteine S-methyltransferase [Lentilactobacillus fungorum]|jgi:methylated-DNA-[protein]-cysteine S-methyltransferase|uniref:Methylated-DNA--[protein]-cysteine S-methyltransferase n=1 Tax=Lentilactobacillus fungorum TaxID=2201250 RepID=A0ABQ3W3B4_9LACO|nr:methylated-DNA--[protein]-cysteine S-methyltransferase [Lentilactobacillus fungorum]GHP14851.1 methylated-DNA--[protein]-cysteine S-methyltransferase [Lentilactobacillus fungorum]